MDIDKLFKVPKIPSTGNKRRLPDNPTPEMLKKMKFDATPLENEPAQSDGNGTTHFPSRRAVTVEEVEDETSPGFAPGGDADYFAEEDDEGRFFGGGLTSEQKEILNIFDSAAVDEGPQDERLSITSIRRTLLRFERAVHKNQDHRSKHPDDPTKFIDSEADLDSAIKSLLPLAQAPVLAFPEFARSGTVLLLIGLLTHDNVDIVIDVVELIHELTDEESGNEPGDDDNEEEVESSVRALVDSLVENSILELLVGNLARLNENEDSDRQGVFHILGIFENILGLNPALSLQLASKTKFMQWLLQRIQSKNHDENRGYAAELLSILLQDNVENRLQLGRQDGVETLLKVLAQYRRRDPVDADENEFMENVFDTLCSALNERSNKLLFLEAEGPDLMVLMMKEKRESKSRSIKTLDYAMSGFNSSAICEAFIAAFALKTLFSAFMGKLSKNSKGNSAQPASEDLAHILGIISSLFSNLPSESPARIRLLAKFVEDNYEKVDKLLDVRDGACSRLRATDTAIEVVKQKIMDEEGRITAEEAFYLQRLDGGLYTLQIVDYILAWVIMEDDGIRAHALQMLGRQNKTLKDILSTLHTYHNNVDEPDEGLDVPSQKEILQSLITVFSSAVDE